MSQRSTPGLPLRAHRTHKQRQRLHEMIEALERRQLFSFSAFSLEVNFQPASFTTSYPGYMNDSGGTYGKQGGTNVSFGWNVTNPNVGARSFTVPTGDQPLDERYSAVALMDKGSTTYNWSTTVPVGEYLVYVLAGDPAKAGNTDITVSTGSTTLMTVQGATTSASPWIGQSMIVTVPGSTGTGSLVVKDPNPTAANDNDALDAIRIVQIPANVQNMVKEADNNVDNVTSALHSGNTNTLQIRDVAKAVWTELATGYLPTQNAIAPTTLLDMVFGRYAANNNNYYTHWTGDSGTPDYNQVQFTFYNIASALNQYYGQLFSYVNSSSTQGYLKTALTKIESQGVDPSYTNIYTMQATNDQLVGQLVGDSTAESDAQSNINTLIGDTKTQGIFSEYDSPVYSETDWDNLASLDRNLPNVPTGKMQTQVRGLLDYLSEDLSANYFGGGDGSLAGAHARDYNFASSTPIDGLNTPNDPVDHFYAIEGMQVDTKPAISVVADVDAESEGIATYLNMLEQGYHPAATITNDANITDNRVVEQTWGPSSGQDKYTYITPNYAIGSTSYFNTGNDKQVVGSFGSSYDQNPVSNPVAAAPIADVTTVYDDTDDPYGLGDDIPTGTGKPEHLQNNSATVQNQNFVMSVSDLQPGLKVGSTFKYVESNIVIPSNADEYFKDGSPITNFTVGNADLSFNVGDTLGVKVNNTVFAIRILEADNLAVKGTAPTITLQFDGAARSGASKLQCARLVAYHYDNPTSPLSPTGSDPVCVFTYVMAAQYCPLASDVGHFLTNEVQAGKFYPAETGTLRGGEFDYTDYATGTALSLTAQLDTHDDIITAREANGVAYARQEFQYTDTTINKSTNEEQLYLQGLADS